MKRYVQDSNAVADYVINWSDYLGADTIATSAWTPDHNPWEATTSYTQGNIIRLSTGEILEVTIAGISGSSQPSPPAVGNTVVDGSVTWLRSFNVDSDSETDTTATVWVRGGRRGREYAITNHIVTAGGREADETLVFVIVEK